MATRTSAKAAQKPVEKQATEYGEREDGSLSGNLTRDPELKFTKNGKPMAVFGIAVNNRIQDKDGDWVDSEPEFYDVSVWGQCAENCAEYLSKGNRVVAIGYFQTQTYTNKDGERVSKEAFTAREIGPSMLWNGAKIIKAERG
jgi:single-strand DNA-binding protein